jgi:hypothetical protein
MKLKKYLVSTLTNENYNTKKRENRLKSDEIFVAVRFRMFYLPDLHLKA